MMDMGYLKLNNNLRSVSDLAAVHRKVREASLMSVHKCWLKFRRTEISEKRFFTFYTK